MDDTPGLGQPQQAAADKEDKSDRGVSEAVASTYVTQLETRIAALELANAYIEEVRQADTPERSYRARRTPNPMNGIHEVSGSIPLGSTAPPSKSAGAPRRSASTATGRSPG